MTVSELIEILKKYPPDMLVLNKGYKQGYGDIIEDKIRIEVMLIEPDTPLADWHNIKALILCDSRWEIPMTEAEKEWMNRLK